MTGVEMAEHEVDARLREINLRGLLAAWNARFGGIDGVYCAVCGHHRTHRDGRPRLCPNPMCLTHRTDVALRTAAEVERLQRLAPSTPSGDTP